MVLLLLVWSVGLAAFTTTISHPKLTTHKIVTASPPISNSSVLIAKPSLVQLADIRTLPTDPTGQMLPPIALAPDYTYSNDYDWGQCTWYVAGRRRVPSNWGNANTWYGRAQASGRQVGTIPALGAIAWTSQGYYGHVALVEQISANYQYVYVSEMNFVGIGTKSFRWVAASSFKYIY